MKFDPILLLHDSLGSVETWRDFPAQLAEATGRDVIAYDRLGYGQSTPLAELPADDFMAAEARTIVALLDHLGIERAVLAGHSIGGELSLTAAAELPERVSAVVTIAAQSFLEPCTLEAIRAGERQFADPEQFARLEKYHGARARWVLDAWTKVWLSPQFADWSIEPVLPRVRCPVLAIHGGADHFATEAQPRMIELHAAGPVRVEILDGIGHLPHREVPETVIALMAEFLAALP